MHVEQLRRPVWTEAQRIGVRLTIPIAAALTARRWLALLGAAGWRLLFIALIGTQFAACSVTSYRKPVEDFAQATKNTGDALAGLDKQVTDGYADLLRKRVLKRDIQVQLETGDCQTTSARCRIVVKDAGNKKEFLPPNSPMRNMLTLMRSIEGYAAGLAAIVNADTAAQVGTEVSATVASLKNLAETIAKQKGPDNKASVKLADYATPVGSFFNWLAGHYIASVQVDGLRRATVDARPVIAGATEVFAVAANESSTVSRALMAEEVSKRIDAIRTNLTDHSLEEAITAAARFDELLRADPSAVFKQLRDSHDALVAKIQDEDVTLAEVLARIETFAAEAQALANIVNDLQAVGEK